MTAVQDSYQQHLQRFLAERGISPASAEGQAIQEAAAKEPGAAEQIAGFSKQALQAYAKKKLKEYAASEILGESSAASAESAFSATGGEAAADAYLAEANLGGEAITGELGSTAAGETAALEAGSAGWGNLGLSAGTIAGAGAVAAYYGPSYYETGKKIVEGDAKKSDWAKAALLSNPMTSWVVPLAGYAGIEDITFSSGKSKEQRQRDAIRNHLQAQKVTDSNDQWKLSNGSSFDFGKDGRSGVQNVDTSDPLVATAIGMASPLAKLLTGGDEKQATWIAGRLANGALTGVKDSEGLRQNMQGIATQLGFDQKKLQEAIIAASKDEKNGFDNQRSAAYQVGAASIFDPKVLSQIKPVTTSPTSGLAATPKPTVISPPRSSTRSPGIGLDGKRISYAAKR